MQPTRLTSDGASQRQEGPVGVIEHPPADVLIRNIGIATDFCPSSDRATHHALLVARRLGAAVHFLHAISRSEFPLVPDLMVDLDALAERDSDEMLHRLQEVRELDNIETYCWNMDGEIPDACADLTRDHGIDLLVLGTQGRSGLSKLLFGSVAQRICRHTACPVLTVGPWSRNAARQVVLNRVLLVTDLSDESRAAIPYALTAARTWNADVDLLYVRSPGHRDQQALFDDVGRATENLAKTGSSVSIHYHVTAGDLSHSVLAFATQNHEDLIVLGLNGERSIYSAQNGCEAYEVVRQATCPVLSVPGCI